MIGSWLTSNTCRKSTSDWNAFATRRPQRAAASECSEKSVAMRMARNGTTRSYHLQQTRRDTISKETMRKKTRVLFIVSQRAAGEADYGHILAVLRDAGFE